MLLITLKTNTHVTGEAEEINAVLNDGREITATLVGKDPRRDLALVKFNSDKEIPVAELGDSSNLKVGDWVLAVGSPFGFVNSVTAGIVSAKVRSGPENMMSRFIQTDAAINQGNSGGALVNIDGKVVGINTWIAAPTEGSVGLGFAVPIDDAKKSIDEMITKGTVDYGWLGVTVTDMSEKVAEEMKLSIQKGAFIHNVYLDSPAQKGGLRPGDFVTEINGKKITSRDDLVRVVGNMKAGERAEFSIIRYSEQKTVTMEIGKRKDEQTIQAQQNKLWPGMVVVPLEKQAREQLGLDSSVTGALVANLQEKSKPYIGGIRPYDVVTEINDTTIESLMDFFKAVNGSVCIPVQDRFYPRRE